MKETITYRDLTKRLDAYFLFNKAPELDNEMLYEGLENGTLDYCINHNKDRREQCLEEDCEFENHEIFQWFLISPNDAEYLKRNTEELIFYSEVLDEFLWGITHLGTPWENVTLKIKDK